MGVLNPGLLTLGTNALKLHFYCQTLCALQVLFIINADCQVWCNFVLIVGSESCAFRLCFFVKLMMWVKQTVRHISDVRAQPQQLHFYQLVTSYYETFGRISQICSNTKKQVKENSSCSYDNLKPHSKHSIKCWLNIVLWNVGVGAQNL